MEQILIRANILTAKMPEFRQSKLAFIEELEVVPGYLGYSELPGKDYQLSIQWESPRQLDAFLESELYRYFNGAIKTLGTNIQISITKFKTT